MHREAYHASGMSRPRVILTIHNMDNSGECRQDEFAYCGTSTAFLPAFVAAQLVCESRTAQRCTGDGLGRELQGCPGRRLRLWTRLSTSALLGTTRSACA